MPYKYSTQDIDKEKTAKAVSTDVSVSIKQAVEISREIRNKYLDKAKKMLEATIAMKRPVEFRKFNRDMGHKKGMAAGRFPIKACTQILATLKSAEANAVDKGLSVEDCLIKSIVPNKASSPPRYGRRRGREAKRAHIEIVLEEVVRKDKPKKQDKKKPVEEKKAPEEAKPVKEQEEPKAEEKLAKKEEKVEEVKPKEAKPVKAEEKPKEAKLVKEEVKPEKKAKKEDKK